MRKDKYQRYFLLLGLFLLICISAQVSALDSSNVTFIMPHNTNTGIINGTTVINLSIFNIPDQNYTEAILYIQGAGATANNSLILANGTALVKNVTSSNSGTTYNISISINSSLVEDGNDYTLTANLWNGTDRVNVTSAVIVNNTIPDSASSLSPTSDTDGSVTFSASVNGSTTTACYLNFSGINPGKNSYSMTHSGSTCTYTLSVPEQTYDWFVTTSDGSDSAVSSKQTTNVDIKTGSNKGSSTFLLGEKTSVTGERTLSVSGGVSADKPSLSDIWNKIVNWFKSLFN